MLKLFRYLKPYTLQIITVIVLVFIQSICQLFLPNMMANIVNIGIIKQNIPYILRTGGIMLLITGIGMLSVFAGGFFSSRVSMGFGRKLRSVLFSHITSFSLNEFDKVGTPSLITRNTNDIMQIQNAFMMIMTMMIQAPVTCIGGIIMAVSTEKQLAWIIIVVVPVLFFFITSIVRKVFPLMHQVQKKLDKINMSVRENLAGIRVIRAFNRIEFEKGRFEQVNRDFTDTSIKVFRLMSVMFPFMNIMMNVTMLAVIWFASIRIEKGLSDIGNMMAFLQYVAMILFSLLGGAIMFAIIPRAQVAANRINEVLDIKPEINDPEKEKEAKKVKGFLEFKNVTFRYQKAEEPALKNVSFSAKPGEVTAIIGSTGSGKTTLINLIPRFYDADEGSIMIDGTDIRDMNQQTLRKKIGLAPQNAVLFSGTIAYNIKFGNEDASDSDIIRAAQIAQAKEFIDNLEDGFASYVAQAGTNFSGGQKQRLSIARAIAGKPEIYIFDDSFSALDFKTDLNVRSALRKETKNSTVIIIGQRVATIMDADRIIVLDEGGVSGIGTHKLLYRTCKVYREIVDSQLSKEELK